MLVGRANPADAAVDHVRVVVTQKAHQQAIIDFDFRQRGALLQAQYPVIVTPRHEHHAPHEEAHRGAQHGGGNAHHGDLAQIPQHLIVGDGQLQDVSHPARQRLGGIVQAREAARRAMEGQHQAQDLAGRHLFRVAGSIGQRCQHHGLTAFLLAAAPPGNDPKAILLGRFVLAIGRLFMRCGRSGLSGDTAGRVFGLTEIGLRHRPVPAIVGHGAIQRAVFFRPRCHGTAAGIMGRIHQRLFGAGQFEHLGVRPRLTGGRSIHGAGRLL